MARGDGGQSEAGAGGAKPRRGLITTGFEVFRDQEGTHYYVSELRPEIGPQGTWKAIAGRLAELYAVVRDETRGSKVMHITRNDLEWWHRRLFAADFRDGGEVRAAGRNWFPVMGSADAPGAWGGSELNEEIRQALAGYEKTLADAQEAGEIYVETACRAAATLYTDLLRAHPFRDGNGRAASVGLQGALRSLGQQFVVFVDVDEYDTAIASAIDRRAEIDVEPLTRLLISLQKPSGGGDRPSKMCP